MKRLNIAVIAVVVLSGSSVGTTHASLVVGNLNGSFNGLTSLAFSGQRAAASFKLNSNFTPAILDSVNLSVGSATSGMSADGYLCLDNAGRPGAIAVSLGSIPVPQSFGGVTFTPNAAFTLEPDTKYWVVLSHPVGSGDLQWTQTLSNTSDFGSNPAAAIQSGSLMSSNSGVSWFTPSSGTFRFAVSASPVPEPATAILLALIASATLVRRRR